MRLAGGIFLLIGGVWFIFVLLRMLPVGSYKSSLWFHESTWGNVITLIVIIAVATGLGIWLIWGS
jgi:succinate dehydrogenase hydrophobic anchor subunit